MNATSYEKAGGVNLWTLLTAIKRRNKFFIMVTMAFVTINVLGVKLFYSPEYEARALVKFTPGDLVTVSPTDREDRSMVVREEVLNRLILERVISKLGLDLPSDELSPVQKFLSVFNIETEKKKPNIDSLVRDLRLKINIVEAGPSSARTFRHSQSDVFLVSMRGDKPDRISNIINSIVSEYLNEKIRMDAKNAKESYNFLVLRVDEVGKDLLVANKKLDIFKSRNADVISMSQMIGTTIQGTRLDYIRAKSNLADARSREKEARAALEMEPEFLVPETSLREIEEGESFALSPREMLAQMRNQLSSYESRYTDEHPDIVHLRNEISRLEKSIGEQDFNSESNMIRTRGRINPEYQRLRGELMRAISDRKASYEEVRNLEDELINLQMIMEKAPSVQERHEHLVRIRDSLEEQYGDLRNRLREAKITYEAVSSDIGQRLKIIEPAIAPETPVGVSWLVLQFLGIVISVGIGSVSTLLYDSNVKNESNEQSLVFNLMFYISSTLLFLGIVGMIMFDVITHSLTIV